MQFSDRASVARAFSSACATRIAKLAIGYCFAAVQKGHLTFTVFDMHGTHDVVQFSIALQTVGDDKRRRSHRHKMLGEAWCTLCSKSTMLSGAALSMLQVSTGDLEFEILCG